MTTSRAPRLLLVTGAGRSGTSSVAGALSRLGLHIPPPQVEADESNPRGFYESQWVVDLHKELLNRAPVYTIDARPTAARLAATAGADPEARSRVVAWLGEQAAYPQVLVKDPRAFWFHELWHAAASEVGREVSFLTMLRHPAEVAKSRDSAYLAEETETFRRQRTVASVAAWCNVAWETELATRGGARAMVRYTDLLADWRTTLREAAVRLRIDLDADLAAGEHHSVDDFIDSRLRRSQVTWDDTDVPDALRDLADRTWELMSRLADDPQDPTVGEELGRLRAGYALMHDDAVAIATSHTNAREAHVRRTVKRNLARARSERP